MIISKKNYISLIAVILMCFVILPILAISSNGVVGSAETEFVVLKELNIAHITDTHYYPLRYCYNGESDEYYKDMKADTKIQIESSTVTKTLFANVREKGQELDYLVVTGDISKDGERASHIDIANALRMLQNDIRTDGNADFQVFVICGNHDMYNASTYTYGIDGTQMPVDNINRKDFSIIYSSLGYPDITNEEAMAYYTEEDLDIDLATLPYDAVGSSFVNSVTAANVTIKYMYDEADPDYGHGELTYIAETSSGYSFLAIDEEDSNIEDGHVLTATITAAMRNFLSANVTPANNKIALLHHNIVPQCTIEPTLLSGFMVEDWVTNADFLADLGVRYSFSGHMHSNSIAHHTSFNNNQITDIETSGACSYKGGARYVKMSFGTYGEYQAEDLETEYDIVMNVDFTYLIVNGYIPDDYLNSNSLNLFMEGNICTDFSEYAKYRIYENVVDNMLLKYLSPSIVLELSDKVTGIIPDTFLGFNISSIKGVAGTLIENLVIEIETKVLTDYVYAGSNPLFQNGQNKLLGYLEELVTDFKSMTITSDGLNVLDIFFFCYYANISGELYTSIDQLPLNIQEGIRNLQNGTAIQSLIDLLLDKETGIYRIINGLLTEEMDLTTGLTGGEISMINSLCRTILHITNFNAASIKVDELVRAALALLDFKAIDLGTGTLIDFVDDAIESNVNNSFITGLGNIAANIMTGFAIDESPNGNYGSSMHITRNASDMFTYISSPVVDEVTIENGKAPGKLTVTFGEDPLTSKNFNWMTDKRANTSEIIYSTNADLSGGTTVSGEFDIYAYTYPHIDLGVFATLGILEVGRHSVSVTGLQPDTKYYYKVGSEALGYWSPIYSMKTASVNSPFEVLLIADPQGYTQANYTDVFKVLNDIESVFTDGYDFVMSMGDNVDNSENVEHYNYFLNTDPSFWANTTTINAVGNHETSNFEVDEDFVPSSNDVITTPYNNSLLYYNIAYPEQDNILTGVYYSFDYSGVHFTVLNTNDIGDDNKMSQAQVDWLIADLAATTKEHKVVIMHKGLYSGGAHSYDADIIAMRAQLTSVFSDGGVSLVLSGHDHTYSVSYYLDKEGNAIKTSDNGKSKIGEEGTLYITLGTIGNKFYSYQENEEVPIFYGEELHSPRLSNPIFARLIYDGEDLYYEAYEYDLATGEITELKTPSYLAIIMIIAGASIVVAGGAALTIIFMKKKAA